MLFVYQFIKTAGDRLTALCFGSLANMELMLWCVVVFTLVGLVTATPHGYGVKGGAAAKAEANAAAGAFSGIGGLPAAIPAGAGFSGSFSKSSSSSFASSSASSSASSFSFSGSGLAGANEGCSTGICQNSRSGQQGSNGNLNSFQVNNGANTGAAAGSHAGAATGSYPACSGNNCGNQKNDDCQGSSCKKNPATETNCEGGKCQSEPSVQSLTDEDELKSNCTSGQCGSDAGSNAFDFGQKDLNSGDNSKDNIGCQSKICGSAAPNCASGQCKSPTNENKPSSYDKPNTDISGNQPEKDYAYNYNSDKCTTGQCQPQTPKTDTYTENNDIPVNVADSSTKYNNDLKSQNTAKASGSIDSPPRCANGNCGPSPNTDYNPNDSDYPTPASKCSSPDCYKNGINNPHAVAAGSATAPAYNKPATHLIAPKHEPSCTSPACQAAVSLGQYPSSYITPQGIYPTASPCSGGNCGEKSDNNPSNAHFISSSPNYSENDRSPSKCTSPNCASNHGILSHNTPSYNYPSSHISVPGGGFGNKPFSQQAFSLPGTISAAQPVAPNIVDYDSSSSKCTSPNCASNPGIPSHVTPSHNYPSTHTSMPGGGFSDKPIPPQAFSPPGTIPAAQPIAPNVAYSPAYSANKPDVPGSGPNYKPIYTEDNYNIVPGYSVPNNPSMVPNNENPAIQGSIPPHVPLSPSSPSNCAGTGACALSPTRPGYTPGSFSQQTNYGPLGNLPSSHNKPNTGINSVPLIPTKPSVHNSQDKPYTGGFGGPSGVLKPNEFSISSNSPAINNKPLITGTQKPGSCLNGNCNSHNIGSGSYNSGSCPNGNCHSQTNQPASHHQAGIGLGFGGSFGSHNSVPCATGNCGGAQFSQTGTNILQGAHGAAGAVASASAGAYSAGFGGPPGVLKPFDGGKIGKSQSGFGDKYSSNPESGFGHDGGVANSGQTGAGAQAFATAGANAASFSGNNYHQHSNGQHNPAANDSRNASGGCGGGCSPSDGLAVAGAAAKAGASAGSFGYGSSFATGSASAHASSGAAVKGGYGRR